jgi:hypothetical protein
MGLDPGYYAATIAADIDRQRGTIRSCIRMAAAFVGVALAIIATVVVLQPAAGGGLTIAATLGAGLITTTISKFPLDQILAAKQRIAKLEIAIELNKRLAQSPDEALEERLWKIIGG